jgi:hypothetical protein
MSSVRIGNGNGATHELTWASLAGLWSFDGPTARYLGPSPNALPFGLARSSASFRDGQISTTVTLGRNEATTAGIAVGIQSLGERYVSVQLGAWDYAYSIAEHNPEIGWIALARAGVLRNLEARRAYQLSVAVQGQKIRMRVDGVDVLETVLPEPFIGTGAGLFAWDSATVQFDGFAVEHQRPHAFVVMPFREPFDSLYTDVIKPEAEKLDCEITRVDEIQSPGIILDDIRQQIQAAQVVVAEISTENPNVFYEVGYAHAKNKPVVLLFRREEGREPPFNIRGYRAIFYDDTIAGKKKVEAAVRDHLSAVLRSS